MRLAGIILVILGVLAFSIHSVTYFTTDHEVGPLGFFAWDVSHPQTIFVNPLAGFAAIGVGIALLLAARRERGV
ncbi:MAG TPA: hypothetical protein VHV77_17535 [Pirellulales bacterium]|jgi:hypothetical protein|nr:hypothetical protein [Pirellulales bacterium]